AFAALTARAREVVEHWQQAREESQARQVAKELERQAADREFQEVVAEVQALERQPSNIPARMLALRREIAAELGIGEHALPFAGELVEVRSDEAPWQGAIERVLHGFALSMLVEERHYAALCNAVNGRHLGGRLVYYRTGGPGHTVTRDVAPESLLHKLNLK